MPKFMLVLRDSEWDPSSLSPEEMQSIFEKYGAWNARIGGTGNKLRDGEGRVLVRRDGGVTVTDGPYAEAKEILGGYMLVEAESYDEVVRHCQDSPHLQFGSIEIREVERM
jgi:hypothetical protein